MPSCRDTIRPQVEAMSARGARDFLALPAMAAEMKKAIAEHGIAAPVDSDFRIPFVVKPNA